MRKGEYNLMKSWHMTAFPGGPVDVPFFWEPPAHSHSCLLNQPILIHTVHFSADGLIVECWW